MPTNPAYPSLTEFGQAIQDAYNTGTRNPYSTTDVFMHDPLLLRTYTRGQQAALIARIQELQNEAAAGPMLRRERTAEDELQEAYRNGQQYPYSNAERIYPADETYKAPRPVLLAAHARGVAQAAEAAEIAADQ